MTRILGDVVEGNWGSAVRGEKSIETPGIINVKHARASSISWPIIKKSLVFPRPSKFHKCLYAVVILFPTHWH